MAVNQALTAQYGITDPDLEKYLQMASMPAIIAWGDPSAGGSRSQEQQARRAAQQFAAMGGQAEFDRINAKIAADPVLKQQLNSVIAAGNKGDMFSRIGDFAVSQVPTALKLAALAGGADLAMGGTLFGGGAAAGVGGGTGTLAGAGVPSTVAVDPIAAMTGAGTGVSDFAALNSAMNAPGAMLSGSLGNAATGLGYDMLGAAATGGGMLSGVSPAISQAAQTLAKAGITPEQVAANQNNPAWLKSITDATGIPESMLGTVASTGLNMLGGYLQGQSATSAAQTSANAQIEAARIAAEASKFKPVGVTTRFGGSQFGYDAQGNLISAGYNLSPEAKAQQDALMAMSNQALTQYQGAPAAAAPMGQAAQTMFGLGQGYLQTTPQAQAAQYMAEQQALLAPSREREMAALQARLQAQGRLGLSTGGTTTGMLASQPELEALYNAQRMQDLQLAAQATQGGQQYAQFGAGMVGAGGDMLKGMYGTQQAAYAPYQTALGGATMLESLGQQPMDIGTSIGARTSTAAAQAGNLIGTGMMNAAKTMQPANAYNPWVAPLAGAAGLFSQWGQ